MLLDLFKAVLLGIVEGLTEFLPVSSTGHLLLMQRFFGFSDDDLGKTFVVLIQLGAILAILTIYFQRLWAIALGALCPHLRKLKSMICGEPNDVIQKAASSPKFERNWSIHSQR